MWSKYYPKNKKEVNTNESICHIFGRQKKFKNCMKTIRNALETRRRSWRDTIKLDLKKWSLWNELYIRPSEAGLTTLALVGTVMWVEVLNLLELENNWTCSSHNIPSSMME